MPHIVKSTILDAPTGTVWNVLRDFNGHDRWHPAVATSMIERAQASDLSLIHISEPTRPY